MTDSNEVVVYGETSDTYTPEDARAAIQKFATDGGDYYSSLKLDTFDERLTVLDAMIGANAADENLGKTINLANFLIQPVDIADEKTGVVKPQPRITLLDENGTAYVATSLGIFTSLKNIRAVVGLPSSWDRPIPVRIVKQQGRNGFKFMTLERVPNSELVGAKK